jgi:hypothetical protein
LRGLCHMCVMGASLDRTKVRPFEPLLTLIGVICRLLGLGLLGFAGRVFLFGFGQRSILEPFVFVIVLVRQKELWETRRDVVGVIAGDRRCPPVVCPRAIGNRSHRHRVINRLACDGWLFLAGKFVTIPAVSPSETKLLNPRFVFVSRDEHVRSG